VSSQPIGIFDSGLGGLTVFREIAKILPQENLVYLGDTARVPYGTKSAQTVSRYARQNVEFLLQKNVKMVVVACNTATAFALDELRSRFFIPIIGVIEPGVTGALRATKSKRIGVIGTEGTISSGTYSASVLKRAPAAFVATAACPLFVPLVEEGWWQNEITEIIARTYLNGLLAKKIDTLILGCTHYPLLKNILSKVAGPEVTLIDSAEETARAVAEVLAQKNIMMNSDNSSPYRDYCVTDSPERFRRLGDLFVGQKIHDVQHVEI